MSNFLSIYEADSTADSDGSPLMVHILHKYIQDRNNESNLNLLLRLILYHLDPQTCNNTKGKTFGPHVHMCSTMESICETETNPHLDSQYINHPIWRQPDIKCRSIQTRSETGIHQDFTGKDRSSRMRSVEIKIQFPLVIFSDSPDS